MSTENKEGIQFDGGAVPAEQPRMHPTDKRFLVCIIGCLFGAVILLTCISSYRLSKLEKFQLDATRSLGWVWTNLHYQGSMAARKDYVDRVAQAVADLQMWRMSYTNRPIENPGHLGESPGETRRRD